MSPNPLGFSSPSPLTRPTQSLEYVLIQKPLSRILSHTGFSIHDVVNDPIARNAVRGYYKLHRWIIRESETLALERQWNPLGPR